MKYGQMIPDPNALPASLCGLSSQLCSRALLHARTTRWMRQSCRWPGPKTEKRSVESLRRVRRTQVLGKSTYAAIPTRCARRIYSI